jgi:hypothetical protein
MQEMKEYGIEHNSVAYPPAHEIRKVILQLNNNFIYMDYINITSRLLDALTNLKKKNELISMNICTAGKCEVFVSSVHNSQILYTRKADSCSSNCK